MIFSVSIHVNMNMERVVPELAQLDGNQQWPKREGRGLKREGLGLNTNLNKEADQRPGCAINLTPKLLVAPWNSAA